MLQLPNGCRCSDLTVTPKNWQSKSATTKKNWRIYYYFYDPSMSGRKIVRINAGINHIKDVNTRRTVVKKLIEDELYRLEKLGYNPITSRMITPAEGVYEIDPETPLMQALEMAKEKLTVSHKVKIDMKSALKVMEAAVLHLKYDRLPISSTSIRHLKALMERCGQVNKKWSERRYNMYRSYLIMLFTELVGYEATLANPAKDLKIRPVVKKIRKTLTAEQRTKVKDHLKKEAEAFYMFVNLFFHSGGRKTELMQQTTKTVDLDRQKYKALIKKGQQYIEVERTIKNVAMPYWKYFLTGAKSGDFLFGVGFRPAEKPMSPDTISRWWQRLIKDPKTGLGIDVDFYALKHLHTSELIDIMGIDEGTKAAAEHNAHTSEGMVVKFYDVKREDRMHKKLKFMNNKF